MRNLFILISSVTQLGLKSRVGLWVDAVISKEQKPDTQKCRHQVMILCGDKTQN